MGILQAKLLEWVSISFSRGIFPAQGSNPGLLHCGQILYFVSHQGSLVKGDSLDIVRPAVWDGGIRWARWLCLVDWCRYVCTHVCVWICTDEGERACAYTHCCIPHVDWDFPGLEGLSCSVWEASQLFQVTRDHLLKRPWWFEKVNVLHQRESSLLIGVDWTSDFEYCDHFINFYLAASWPLQRQDHEALIYPLFLPPVGLVV